MHERLGRHKKAARNTFAGRYHTRRLVYFETFIFPSNAIAREKEIKGWTRAKKEALIRGDFDALRALARGRDRDGISIVRPSTSLRVR